MNWLIGRRVPRVFGIVVQFAGFMTVHGIIPSALAFLSIRHGWTGSLPGVWNWFGLVPVAAGFYVFSACMREHYKAAPAGWLLEITSYYPTPAYLLTEGPYRYSCHPNYLAEAAIWLGWTIFYGSLVLGGVVMVASLLSPVIVELLIVRHEERGLEARFGETYRNSGAPHRAGGDDRFVPGPPR